jgi:molecular chaperone HscB
MDEARTTTERGCWRCGAAVDGLVCPRCDVVQPVADATDLFAVLGLPRRLDVDVADLERRYHAASRLVHPDRHQTADARERDLSLAASAAVNRAYRTLRDPVARGRYWLELNGVPLGDNGAGVPPAIAAEVFETQELLAELRADGGARRADVEERRTALAARLATLRDAIAAAYAAPEPPPTDDLRRRLAEIAYLGTLLGDVETALGEEPRGTHHRN